MSNGRYLPAPSVMPNSVAQPIAAAGIGLRAPGRASRRSRWGAGYTMVEVMVGLGILAVGMTGILSLQKYTVVGTQNSRSALGGANVAASWVERLRVDAANWNSPNNSDATEGAGLGAFASVASQVPATPPTTANPTSNLGPWVLLGAQTIQGEAASSTAATDAAFCTHARGTWIGPAGSTDALRVEVRTFWARSGRSVDEECAAASAVVSSIFASGAPTPVPKINDIERTRGEYGVHYVTTILRRSVQ
jgi:Tfp pilus assembly protein PilV